METSKAFASLEPRVLKGVLNVPTHSPLRSLWEGFSWPIRAKWISTTNEGKLPEPRVYLGISWPFRFNDDATSITPLYLGGAPYPT